MCTAGEFRTELPGCFFVYSGAFGESGYVLVIYSVAASFGICLGAMNGSGGMVRRGIDRGKLQGTMSDVDDVVPCAAWDKNTVAFTELVKYRAERTGLVGIFPVGKYAPPITNTRPDRTHAVRTSKAIPTGLYAGATSRKCIS